MFHGIQRSEALKNFKKLSENGPRLHDALIRVYDDVGKMIQTHEHKGDFKEPRSNPSTPCRQGKWFGFVFRVKYCSRI
jgi:hypothetical protein